MTAPRLTDAERDARSFLACQSGATMRFLPEPLMSALLAELDAVRAERDALHEALRLLTAEVEEHITANECGTGALEQAIRKVPT